MAVSLFRACSALPRTPVVYEPLARSLSRSFSASSFHSNSIPSIAKRHLSSLSTLQAKETEGVLSASTTFKQPFNRQAFLAGILAGSLLTGGAAYALSQKKAD